MNFLHHFDDVIKTTKQVVAMNAQLDMRVYARGLYKHESNLCDSVCCLLGWWAVLNTNARSRYTVSAEGQLKWSRINEEFLNIGIPSLVSEMCFSSLLRYRDYTLFKTNYPQLAKCFKHLNNHPHLQDETTIHHAYDFLLKVRQGIENYLNASKSNGN